MADDKTVDSSVLHKVAQSAKPSKLAMASAAYDVTRDGPMTLQQVMSSSKVGVMAGDTAPTLQKETIAGLAALKKTVDATEANVPKDAEKKEKDAPPELSDSEVNERLDEMSDLEIDMMLRNYRTDAINNEKQRKLVDASVKPMDLADGILTGEFTQAVVIKKDILYVTFRSTTPAEAEALRRIVLEMQLEDPRLANLSAERMAFMMAVATIVSLNGTEFPSHMKQDGHKRTFDSDIFMKKYELFSSYPAPLIHTLATHSFWFDQRVRGMFTMEAAKNS